ncbi:MAG TPA: sigma-70 family RNA polymerase sigma factor [Opitutaceae bacterium]
MPCPVHPALRLAPAPLAALVSWMSLEAPPGTDGDTADDDRRHMERLAAGESEALRPLFDRWKLPLLSYFYRSLGSHADAEDLALQTFARVYRHAARFRAENRFSTWLFAIARHELLHELRRRRRKPVEAVSPDELELGSADSSADEPGHTRELEEQLLEAVQQLPERQRSALLLLAAGQLSHREIAAALDVSENHLGVILHRGRQALRRHFQLPP